MKSQSISNSNSQLYLPFDINVGKSEQILSLIDLITIHTKNMNHGKKSLKFLEINQSRTNLDTEIRKFIFHLFLTLMFTTWFTGQHVNKCVDAINNMIWKYNIVTIDRLVLCLALRTQEGSEAQVRFGSMIRAS